MQILESKALLTKTSKHPPSWFWHALRVERGYSTGTVQRLMESFEVDNALLAAGSTWDSETMTVETPFAEDNFLEMVENDPELMLDEDDMVGDNNKAEVNIEGDAAANLAQILRNHDDNVTLKSAGSGPSRRSAFSSSTGNSSMRSQTTAKYARDFKEKALDLAKEKKKVAEQEQQLKTDKEEKLKMEQEIAELRARLQQQQTLAARGTGPKSSTEDPDPVSGGATEDAMPREGSAGC